MIKTKSSLTTGLIICVLILAFSGIVFYFGFLLSRRESPAESTFGLISVVVSMLTAVISSAVLVKLKTKLDILIEYGTPVFIAAEYIKDITRNVNVYGVESLQNIVEITMKKQVAKAIDVKKLHDKLKQGGTL